jgi:DNA-binding GntR family transcriptional regulator
MPASSQSAQAYTDIKRDILTCRLEPGSRIAQAQLVARYTFGLTPIREALKRLEQEGFVLSIARFGYRITPVTLTDVEDLYDLRQILETSALRLAIERASDAQVAEMQRLAGFRYTFGDPASYLDFLERNVHFHMQIGLLSNNRKLAELIGAVLNQMTRIFNLGLDLRDSAEEMQAEHIALAAAIARRDLPAALAQAEAQIAASRLRVCEMLSRRPVPADPNDWLTR